MAKDHKFAVTLNDRIRDQPFIVNVTARDIRAALDLALVTASDMGRHDTEVRSINDYGEVEAQLYETLFRAVDDVGLPAVIEELRKVCVSKQAICGDETPTGIRWKLRAGQLLRTIQQLNMTYKAR